MAAFVLVHPAWMGGWCWRKVAPLLRQEGHEVHCPTLTGFGERAHLARPEVGLDTHVEDICRLLECEDLRRVLLVGNSSGGAVITGVADRAPDRLARVVYLDAFVPEDGQCIFDLVAPDRRSAMETMIETEGDGWLLPRFAPPPWEAIARQAWQITSGEDLAWFLPRLAPTPVGHFSQPFRRNEPVSSLARSYVRCTRFEHAGFDRYAEAAHRLPGWTCHELDAPHLPFVTHPAELATLLTTLARSTPESP
ncbi:MAG: alpha/beta fold hydrolase [Acidimicrobiales bacterium]